MNTQCGWIKRGARLGVLTIILLAGSLSLLGCQCTGGPNGSCTRGLSDGGSTSGSNGRTGGSIDTPG